MMNKQRIIVLASTYPRWLNDTEPGFVAKLSHKLSKEYEVHVLAPHYLGAKREEVLDGIRVFRYRYAPDSMEHLAYSGGILENLKKNPFLFLIIPFFLCFQFITLLRLHKRFKYSAIHAHWIIPQGIIASLYKRLFAPDLPLLITSHGGDLFALNGRIMTRLKQFILQQADHITVVSQVMKDYLVKLTIPSSKVTVRSMGVDLEKTFRPIGLNGVSSDEGRDGFIFVGRLVEKKGVAHLIEAFAQLKSRYPLISLKIVGDGPLQASLELLAERLNVAKSVHFVGSVRNSEIPQLLRVARVAVVPSVVAKSGDQEGLGLVVVEALGCECMVVASDLPAIRDVIEHGETGLLTEPGNSMKLAECLEGVLNNPAKITQYAIAGREFVLDRFDWEQVGGDYARIIAKLINAP